MLIRFKVSQMHHSAGPDTFHPIPLRAAGGGPGPFRAGKTPGVAQPQGQKPWEGTFVQPRARQARGGTPARPGECEPRPPRKGATAERVSWPKPELECEASGAANRVRPETARLRDAGPGRVHHRGRREVFGHPPHPPKGLVEVGGCTLKPPFTERAAQPQGPADAASVDGAGQPPNPAAGHRQAGNGGS